NLSDPIDQLFGVTLNDSGEVLRLDMINNNLKGGLPNLNLPALQVLAMSSNELRDTLPPFSFMRALSLVDLSSNVISGPIPNFNHPALETIRLHDNRLSGNLPPFSNVPKLSTLVLDDNMLSGGFPDLSAIGTLFNLRIANNDLDGPLFENNFPSNLLVIDLHGNNFSGSIPQFGSITSLFILDLSDNDLSSFIPQFNFLNRFLEILRLSGNRLTGNIPSLNQLEELQILDLSDNLLGGILPSFSGNTKLTELNVSNNDIQGTIPGLSNFPFLERVYLSENQFTDTLPDLSSLPSLNDLRVDGNCLNTSAMDAGLSTSLQILHVQNNQFTFRDLFAINGAGLIGNFLYAPQKEIPMPDTLFATLGDNVTIDLVEDEGVMNNTYQWFLADDFITATAVNQILLPSVNKLDEGLYHAIVANNFLPALSLFSEEVLLLIDCPINVIEIVDTICQGDTLFVNDKPYFEEGVFSDTIPVFDPGTCDSVFIITLSINPVFDTLIADTVCASEIYVFGDTTLEESGFYIDTLTSAQGCDSIVRLVLTVHPIFTRVREVEICAGDTLFVGPIFHTEQGIYFDTLQTSFGCDSVIISDVSVLDTFISVTDVALCFGESFEFRGAIYDESGTYVDAFQTLEGCDSLFILNLTIPSSDLYVFTKDICVGDTVLVGDTFYTEPGTYMDSLVTGKGCDSIVMLTLGTVDLFEVEFDFEICQGDTIFFGDDTLTAPGIYLDSLTAAGGCDSIVKVRLNVVDFVPLTIDTLLCFGDSLVVGTSVYKVSGIFRDTLPSSSPCDTIVVSVITVVEPIRLVDASIRLDANTNLGSILPIVSGGMGGYQYEWSNGATSLDLTEVPTGDYSLIVTDAVGCDATFQFLLDTTTSIFSSKKLKADLKVVPNPASEGQRIQVIIENLVPGEYQYQLLDVLGVQHETRRWQHRDSLGILTMPTTLHSGTYFFRLIDRDGRSVAALFVVK
ncbi:MAG: hypothetical protein OEQ53_15670, partial [Saprospiraceae bacterium]|nr:hypothetical protein [Saprospiraceae bacterium]